MPDLAEKRWNAKILAQTSEQNRKQQIESVKTDSDDNKNFNKSSSSFLDFEGKPLHRELAKSLRMNVFKKTTKNSAASTTATHQQQHSYSGKKWFTKSQISQLGYQIKPNSEPIFSPHH